MYVFVTFLKRLLTSFLSIIDIVSDLVNSCDLLGYQTSTKIMSGIFGDDSRLPLTTNLSKSYAVNYTAFGKGESKYDNNFTIKCYDTSVSSRNGTFNKVFDDLVTNTSLRIDEDNDIHLIWGVLSVSIMFLPGAMAIFMSYNSESTRPIFEVNDGPKIRRIRNILLMALFPLTVILLQLYGLISYKNKEIHGFTAIGVALEAFLESFLQLVLQLYTIYYGYSVTTTQIVAICASFAILSKASIDLDLEMYFGDNLSVSDTIIHYTRIVPGYCATIAFRALAFSSTLAFLRLWSIIPMFLLVIELTIVYWI